jgi:hypothetical protein
MYDRSHEILIFTTPSTPSDSECSLETHKSFFAHKLPIHYLMQWTYTQGQLIEIQNFIYGMNHKDDLLSMLQTDKFPSQSANQIGYIDLFHNSLTPQN